MITSHSTSARPLMDVGRFVASSVRSPPASQYTIMLVIMSEIFGRGAPPRERRARDTRRAGVHLGAALLLVSSLHLVDMHPLFGQEPGPPRPDQRVRLRAPSLGPRPASGHVVGLSTDTAWIRLESGEASGEFQRIVQGTRLRRFEQSPGRRAHGLHGILVGISSGLSQTRSYGTPRRKRTTRPC